MNMKRILLLLALLAFLPGCKHQHYWKGADIGWATEYESRGLKFYNREGEERECTALMKELGLDAVRFRVWVDPSRHGGWNSKEDLLVKAKRANDLGMAVMVDFHYSDFWADPKKQNIPEAWSGKSRFSSLTTRRTSSLHLRQKASRPAGCRSATRSPTASYGRSGGTSGETPSRIPSAG